MKAKREAIREHLETRQKKHWTQTPEGRKKMGRIQRKAWRKRRVAEAEA